MMTTVVALLFLAGLAASVPQDAYPTKYDMVNIDEILNNERLYQNYFKCFTNKGKCSQEAEDIKGVIPDALKTKCSKCSEKQKAGIEKVLRFTLEKKPQDYTELEAIYDPEGAYRKLWEDEATSRGIQLPPKA